MDSSAQDVIQSLWLGELTTMERLSVSSFFRNGHEFHLYMYKPMRAVPAGITLRNANEVIPSDLIFRDSRNSFAAFADYFRYKLLLDRGGWWVDTDVVCIQPFTAAHEHLFAVEPDHTIATAVIRAPAGSEVMARAWEECLKLGTIDVEWGAIGPELLGQVVEEMGCSEVETEPSVFFPIDWSEWSTLIMPGVSLEMEPQTKGIHLWNSMWMLEGADKDADYPSDCIYEHLKRRYLPS